MIEDASSSNSVNPSLAPAGTMIDVDPQAPWLSLRQLRESQGLQLQLLASQLKVNPNILQALEEGRFDALPKGSFARTLAANICRHLKVDAAPLLAVWPKVDLGPLAPKVSVTQTPVDIDDSSAQVKRQRRLSWWVGIPVLVLAVWIWFAPPLDGLLSGDPPATAPAVSADPTEPAEPGPNQASAPVQDALPQDGDVAQVPQSEPAVVSAAANLSFRASEKSWVEIKRRDGTLVFSSHLLPGQTQTVTEAPPLMITIGNASGVTMIQGGAVFDFQPFAQQNVARFEVR